MPSNVYERDVIGAQVSDVFNQHISILDTLNPGVPTSLEFAKASSPNTAGSRAASTPGKSPLKVSASGGVYWFAGAGEEQGENIQTNDYRSPDSYWFAQAADGDNLFPNAGNGDCQDQDGAGGMFSQVDREERIRILRERQTEERQKKLDELKLAALHAQKVREQQEDERRRKIDELRMRDHERRSQVEERKKIIWVAEKERKEAILRKNLERETRLEAKRNAQRSSIGFAFGSSTPRIFDVESGYFGSRRAASQSNMSTSMINGGSRHSAEREIEKKKAISAYSLDNKTVDQSLTSTSSPFSQWSSAVISPSFSEDSLDKFPVNSRTGAPTACDPEEAQTEPCPPPPHAFPTNRFAVNLVGSGVLVGEDLMTRSCTSIGVPLGRGRRKTDLHPTILAVQDSPRNQSPGRAYSMTRLDQLAAPRRHVNLQALHESSEQRGNRVVTTTNSLGSKTKSMTHLAHSTSPCRRRLQSANKRLQQTRAASKSLSHLASDPTDPNSLQKNEKLAKSLWQLPPTAPPRPTRASQLRANAMLLLANRAGMSRSMMQLVKKKSGDESDRSSVATRTTPSSPSRPNSSLSQQSISSHASQNSVSMRARTPARRSNRPLSIAGSTPDSVEGGEERQGRSTDRKPTPVAKTPRAKSVGAERVVGDVSLSVAKAPPLPSSARKPPSAARNEAVAKKPFVNSPRDKPKVAPKPAKLLAKASPKQSPTVEQAPPIPAASPDEPKDIPSETKTEMKKPKVVEAETAKTANTENIPSREETPPPTAETAAGTSGKPRLTTEGEAKAALAERRRQAREQAEREAELERQRQEQLQREEEERIRQEEEERQRWEIEQDELRIIEAERLQKAIEEQSLREEEERKKKDEEAKLKIERQEQERKAREEQEKIRKETEEQLRKEEEERAERRKRVEAIMSRTRGKGSGNSGNTPVTTPTKPHAELPGSEQSPMQTSLIVESKPNIIDDLMSTSMPSVANEWNHNGDVNSHANGVSTNPFVQEMDHGADEQVAVVEPADDFASRDIINQKPQVTNADFEQLIDLSVCAPTNTFSKNEDFINNADSLNSNVPSNGTSAPFIAFEDNFAKKQETNVTDIS